MINAHDIQFYQSKFNAAADNESLTSFPVEAGSTTTKLVSATLTQAEDYFLDCIVLMDTGEFAHVSGSNQSGTYLDLYRALSVAPTGNFKIIPLSLVANSNYRSSERITGLVSTSMMAGVDSYYLPHVNGVGAGGLYWTAGSTEMQYKAPGDASYGAPTVVSGDGTYNVYADQDSNGELNRYIEISVNSLSLPVGNTESILTVTRTESALIPATEADQSAAGIVRYMLVPVKNVSATDAARFFEVTALAVQVADSTMDGAWNGSDSTFALVDGTGFPTASFWVYNSTKDDCAYIKYRSGVTLYPVARTGALRDLTSVPWVNTDVIEVWSDIDIAIATPVATVYPADLTALAYVGSESFASAGTIAIGGLTGFCIRETVIDKVYPIENLLSQVKIEWA